MTVTEKQQCNCVINSFQYLELCDSSIDNNWFFEIVRLMSRDTMELLEITSEDVGCYQCLVDNGGQPMIENHTVILAGITCLKRIQ